MSDPDFPHRPQHPDFERLTALVRGLDARAEDEPVVQELLGAAGLDGPTAAYMGYQRALRARTSILGDLDMDADAETTLRLAATWLEGFILGATWQRGEAR